MTAMTCAELPDRHAGVARPMTPRSAVVAARPARRAPAQTAFGTTPRGAVAGAFAWDTLVAQVAHGDVAAFEALHREARPFLSRVARNAIGQLALAEEIVQDALLKVWTHAHRFDAAAGPAVTWLATIVRNRARDVARHLAPERAQVVRPDARADGSSALEAIASDADGPAEIAERRQRVPALGAAVRALPERDQHVIWLAYGEGLTHTEIAVALDEPLGTVKTRLRRAHEKLARALV